MRNDCCCPPEASAAACGCCEGVEVLTPLPTANRPGLPALSYRIGTHARFLGTMEARLSGLHWEVPRAEPKEQDRKEVDLVYPLKDLTSREADDLSIALLDAWATVADVLTFYQERIANEGYLRTATERRSVLELGRLVGYKPRPGVASSVYLSYKLDDNFKDETIIPKSARSQSIPGPGELPQSFETSEDLKARAAWNNLKPRMTRPQTRESIQTGDGTNQHVYLQGIATNLRPEEPLLIDLNDGKDPALHWIKRVVPEPDANRTRVVLHAPSQVSTCLSSLPSSSENRANLIRRLVDKPTPQYANSLRLPRSLASSFVSRSVAATVGDIGLGKNMPNSPAANVSAEARFLNLVAVGDASHGVLKAFAPVLLSKLPAAVSHARVTQDNEIHVYALRVKCAPFGHNAPRRPVNLNPTTHVMEYSEWDIGNPENKIAPTPLFSWEPATGAAPLTVTFDNESTGHIEKVRWNIAGSETGEWAPSHTFQADGTYQVTLTVSNAGGSSTKTEAISVQVAIK
mgnify:CR=1 FL=1